MSAVAEWWSGHACGFDLETDSAQPEDARIISANVTQVSGKSIAPVDVLLQPERDILDDAAAIHGITTEHARAHGISRKLGIEAILSVLEFASAERPMVGHNCAFDLTILDREMRRLGIGSLGIEQNEFAALGQVTVRRDGRTTATFPVIDTYVLDKLVDRYRPGSRKLGSAAAHYGVAMGEAGAHDAGADVLASLRIAWRIAQRCRENSATLFDHYRDRRKPEELVRAFYALAPLSIQDLHIWLTKAAAEQADGLRAHFRRNPDKGDAATVSGDWPLRPFI